MLPTSWSGLTDEQFTYVAGLLAGGLHSIDDVRTLFIAHLAAAAGASFADLASADFAAAIDTLEWIGEPPTSAVRPGSLRQCSALHPLLSGTPFSAYLSVENFFQGYLASRDDAALDAAAAILYPGITDPLSPAERYIVLLWMSSLKAEYAMLFPELFRSSSDTFATPPDQRDVMNAQIRALTGGDVTKTASVLATDTLTALTELDAKAREAREMDEKMKK